MVYAAVVLPHRRAGFPAGRSQSSSWATKWANIARMSAATCGGGPQCGGQIAKAVPGYRFAHAPLIRATKRAGPVARMSASDMRGCRRQGRPPMSLRSRSAHPGYKAGQALSPHERSDMRETCRKATPDVASLTLRSSGLRSGQRVSITGSRPMSRASWRSRANRRSPARAAQPRVSRSTSRP
jgi:hypothetical protein